MDDIRYRATIDNAITSNMCYHYFGYATLMLNHYNPKSGFFPSFPMQCSARTPCALLIVQGKTDKNRTSSI